MPPLSSACVEALRAPRRRRSGILPAAGTARAPTPPARRWARAFPLLAAVCFGAPLGASAEPVPGAPSEAIARLTTEKCDTCWALADYMARKEEYVYVLFYGLNGSDWHLNMRVLEKFEHTAQEWIHSRVAFAKMNIEEDRAMAEKVMVPSKLIFRDGKGLHVDIGDNDRLRTEYSYNPEGHKWLLTKYLGDDSEGTNLHYAVPVKTAKSLKKVLEKHKMTVVAHFEVAKGDAWEAFHEFAWSAHQPVGAAVTDGRRLKADVLRLGFASAVANMGRSIEGVPAPAVALYLPPGVRIEGVAEGGKPLKVFPLQGEQTRRELLSSLAEWVASELTSMGAPIEQEL